MNHKAFQELLDPLLREELSPEQQAEVERHVHECPSCREELEQMRKLTAAVRLHRRTVEVDDQLLQEARQQLREALRRERSRPDLAAKGREILEWALPLRPGILLGGATMLLAGILIGRSFFASGPSTDSTGTKVEPSAVRAAASFEEPPRIMNLQFNQTGSGNGEVDFTFDAVTPVHMRGNINDEKIQAVLAHALVTEQNPGVRLRSVNMLASQVEELNTPDPTVKKALVSAAKSDDNPAVRREALRVLKTFPFDDEIRETFLYVLVHDTNPGLRIAAINSLDSARVQTRDPGPDLLRILQEKMRSDDNNYVRIRAKAVLEEATHQ